MKRFVIVSKRKGPYIIPALETREFNYPKKLGSYCAENGELYTSLDDGKRIFEDESKAKIKLDEIIKALFSM